MKMDLAAIIRQVVPDAYYVGGAVRDALLKKLSGDIDLALPKDRVKPAALALAKALKAAAFEMDAQFGVWRVVTHKEKIQIDLTAFQGQNLEEDLLRRDFTFNSLAYPVTAPMIIETVVQKNAPTLLRLKNIYKKHIIDLNGGMEDLSIRLLRFNHARVFQEDPLRLLRAFRTAAELQCVITTPVLEQIKKDASLITQSAGERIQEELRRLFNTRYAHQQLVLMNKTGLLTALFPELEAQRSCAKCYYGEGGVLKHTLDCFKREEWLLENLDQVFPKYYKKLLPVADKPILKMAVLLHDVAKPATAKKVEDRLRFFYHEQKGAAMARQILERLHYSKADSRLICTMISEHLRPSNLASNDVITDRGVYKFFRDLDDAALPLLLLCWADYTSYISEWQLWRILPQSTNKPMSLEKAKRASSTGKTLRHMQVLSLLLKKYFDSPKKIRPAKLLDGKDVMDALHLPSSPHIGEILEAVALAQVEGTVTDRESALDFVRQHFADKQIAQKVQKS